VNSRIEAQNDIIKSRIIRDLIEEHEPRAAHMKDLYKRYKTERLEILKRQSLDNWAANNKLINAYRTDIIDQVVGYMYGEPINYELPEGDETSRAWLNRFIRENQLNDLDSITGKRASICGEAARLLYMNPRKEVRVMHIPPWEAIFIKDRSIDEVQYALRYYPVTVSNRERLRVEWYDQRQVAYFIQTDTGDYVLDDTESMNPQPHMFGRVPLIQFVNNDEHMGDFEIVEPLIDAYDRLISDAQNILEDFRAAYMVFEGGEAPEPADIDEMKRSRSISAPPGGSVRYLTKDVNDQFLENQKRTLQKNIYKFSQTVDMDDDAFHSAESGEARKWRLLALENKSIIKERKFTQALEEMFRVVFSFGQAPSVALHELTFDFRRNLPIDLQYLGDVAGKLKGIISHETLLSQMPFIEDPRLEIEKINEEREAMLADMPDFEEEEG